MSEVKKEKKKFQMPSSIVVVFLVLLLTAILTWVIPVSVSTVDEQGTTIVHFNSSFDEAGNVLAETGTQPAGIWDIIVAPIRGFSSAASVNISILISGAFLGIVNYVGALDAGIGKLLKRFSGKTLIAILIMVFATMGTVYGSWEELPAYALILIPLFVTAGYDVMTGMAVLFVGATIGNMASVVNPFSTGAAVAAIGNSELSLGTGISLRMILFAVMYVIGTFMVIQYAEKVKANKANSIVADLTDINTLSTNDGAAFPELTTRRKWTLIVFGLMILSTILGYIPWYAISVGEQTMYEIVNAPMNFLATVPILGNLLGASSFTPLGDWYFDEFSVVFLLGCIIVGFINRMHHSDFVREFVKGAEELLSLTLVISIARGVSGLMGTSESGIGVTFVYWIQNVLRDVPVWAFVITCLLAYMLIGLFLQGTSSVAGITMPILGAVAFALFATTSIGGEAGQMVLVSCFTVGLNFTNGLFPEATKMGVIELCNVPYDRLLRFMFKMLLPILIAATVIITIAPYVGLI